MSSVIFGSSFSFITAATPSTGWVIGYDTDGVLKQKYSDGTILPIGGGPTAGNSSTYSLYQVLSSGNNTGNKSIISGTSTYIKSSNGGGKIELDYLGLTNSILISTDNSVKSESGLLLKNGSTNLFSNGYKQALELDNGTGNISLYNKNGSGSILLGVSTGSVPYTEVDEIKISFNTYTHSNTGDYDKQSVFIATRNSYMESGVVNSVIIGGQNFTASQSDSVYIPNLYIQSGKGIKSTDSNEVFFLNDPSGVTLLDRNSGYLDSSWSLMASDYNSNKEWLELGVNSDPGYGTGSNILIHNTKGPSYSWQNYSSIHLEKSNLKLESTDLDSSGDTFTITLNPTTNDATIEGPSTTFKGLEYADDYSGSFSSRSLVDKNYVDTQLSNPILSGVLSSGNNSGTNSIIMGTSTSIKSSNGGGQINLDFTGTQNDVLISNDNGALSKSYIYLNDNNLSIETIGQFDLTVGVGLIGTGDSEGLKYTSTYDATFVTNSLITKGYVDSGTDSIWNYIADMATGSGTHNYISKWDSVHNLSSTSSLYVTDYISEYEFTTKSVGTTPISVDYDDVNKYVYVANAGSNNVTIIDTHTLETVGTVSVGNYPISSTWDSKNDRIYVANQNSNNVSIIDSSTNTVTGTISVGTFPTGIIFDKNNDLIFVSNQLSGSVSVIDTSSNTITSSISLSTPRSMTHDFNNDVIWVTGVGPDYVAKIDTNSLTITGTVSVGINPYGAAYDFYQNRIYVTNYVSNSVSVIDISTDTVISTISVGSNPDGISFDPENNRMYVACSGSGEVYVINTLTNTVISTITLNFSPREFAYDKANLRMVVSNSTSNSVHFIETINKSDFIGVKTTNPSSLFDVRGKITTEEFKLTTGANNGYFLVSDELGNGTWQYPIIEIIGGTGLTGSGTSGVITIVADLEENGGLTFSSFGEITTDFSIVASKTYVDTGTSSIWNELNSLSGSYITGITAGNGLSGGGTSGFVSLDVNVGNGLELVSDQVYLGGTLSQTTTIDLSTYDLTINTDSSEINLNRKSTTYPGSTNSIVLEDKYAIIRSKSTDYNSNIKLDNEDNGQMSIIAKVESPTYSNLFELSESKIRSFVTSIDGSGSASGIISYNSTQTLTSGDVSTNNNLIVIDQLSNKGLVYDEDYSSNFTDNSLVSKGYVDAQISTSTSKYSVTRGFTASTTETITHGLGTDEIIVQAYDSTGIQLIPGTVQINGLNDVDITFSSTLSNIKIIVIG